MTKFAEAGWQVYFIENTGFRNPKIRDFGRLFRRLFRRPACGEQRNPRPRHLNVVSPFVAPPNGSLYRLINRLFFVPWLVRRLKNMGASELDVAYVYLPSNTTLELLDKLRPRTVVYDCVAHFEAHPDAPSDFARIEREILRRSKLVVTDSDYLASLARRKHQHVIQLHHGIELSKYTSFYSRFSSGTKSEYSSICFFGTVDDRLDWDAVESIISHGFRLQLIGHLKCRLPAGIPFVNAVSPNRLAKLLEEYDALIIPYLPSEFARGIIPAKLFECLATGKPTLVSDLPSFRSYADLVYICESPQDYIRVLRNLHRTETEQKIRARQEVAASMSSQKSFEALLKAILECGTDDYTEGSTRY